MQKISIKREQSQAGLSFAERENRRSAAGGKAKFRPQVKNKLLLLLALLLTAATGARAQISGNSIDISSGESGTLSSDMTCTYFVVVYNGTLTVNQGVTLTLYCEEDFNLKNNSAINLHGTMTGSVGDDADWNSNSYINVYLSDGAKYTVSGLECMDGYGYLRYYGYDAATDGHGTVSVTNGSTAVTASSIGYSSTTYTFTATPASGYHFVNWTKGAGGEELGTDASIDVTCEQNGQYQVYANFEEDATAATTYTVSLKDNVKDADKWTISPTEATTTGVAENTEVTLQYNGRLKVKGVKATSEAPAKPAATVTTAPQAKTDVEAGSTTALIEAGVADGGTLRYAVTTTNTKPTSTDGFSESVPTAEDINASGTVYVWYYVKGDDTHSDSEIAGPVSVTVPPALSLTNPVVGQVIGSDGKNYAAASVPSGVTKVAMIAYVSGSNGLAIALADEGSFNWATAKSTCEAKTPAFTGGTWHLPSQAEWNQMFSANGGDEESYGGLNTAINTAGGTALLEKGTGYWSSTPDGSKANYVYLIKDVADWRSIIVNIGRQVRACLAF